MESKNKLYEVSYFIANQIFFLVTGDSSAPSIEALLGWAKPLADKKQATLTIDPQQVLRFPPPLESPSAKQRTIAQEISVRPKSFVRPAQVDRGPFALVPASVTWDEDKHKNKTEGQTEDQRDSDEAQDLLDLIFLLDKNRKKAPGGMLQVVSPNWLASDTSKPGGTGGPGGKPKPYVGKSDNLDYCIQFPSASAKFLQQLRDGDGVVVAILDTAPDPAMLDSIYDEWVTKNGRNHRLICTLLEPKLDPRDRRLIIYPNQEAGKDGAQEMKTIEHDYDMTDHGLFVAGIIHSLAPKAKLHLYQVLNRYGVGDLRSIAQALQHVISQYWGSPLVINLSLTINIPLVDEHSMISGKNDPLGKMILHRKPWGFMRFICMIIQWILGRILGRPVQLCNKSWFDRQAWAAEWICDSVNMLRARIVAAAGNNYDSRNQTHRPQACYPAAFEGVTGVGALPKIDTPPSPFDRPATASYSNLSDHPAGKGITTLGGEEGEDQGVLGIYVGPFPDREPNNSGWAWWCGTSFATPIISGVTAALMSGMALNSTNDPMEAIYTAHEFWTRDSEDILYVIQKDPRTPPPNPPTPASP